MKTSFNYRITLPRLRGTCAAIFASRARTRRRSRPPVPAQVESLEERRLLSATSLDPAPIDGFGNNVDHPEWGSAGVELLRLLSVAYGDGQSTPAGADRPGAREISNTVVAQGPQSILNDRYLTDFIWMWGQFLDHDLDLTEAVSPLEPMPIPVPLGDDWFDPDGTGTATIGLNRSLYDHSTGGTRQQINQITAFIDGSMVYGSDSVRAAALRELSGGRLKTSGDDLLPLNDAGLPNAPSNASSFFLAGDVRANENVALTAMHTLFVREHNRLADEIAAGHPGLSDEEIYQRARAIVAAEIQAITFNEFLPALLGPAAIDAYAGYDPTVNPGIANEFSTAAFRLGHTLLSPSLRLDHGDSVEFLDLRHAFFRPDLVTSETVAALLRGGAGQRAQESDAMIVDDVRNFLFGPPGSGGLDLASLNIQRGRDHGLPDYNQARIDLGLTPVDSFDDISSDPVVQARLAAVYSDVGEIDIWVGGLAEDHLPGSSLGELFTTIVVDQFERVRDGDRFWYENVFSGELLAGIHRATLADIIERNTDITGLQENVFFDPAVFYHELDGSRHHMVTLRASGRSLVLTDYTGRTVVRRDLRDVEQVLIVGTSGASATVTLDVDVRPSRLPGGIHVDIGDIDPATLIVLGSSGRDNIHADAVGLSLNGLTIGHTGIDVLAILAGNGSDHVDVSGSEVPFVLVLGGDGNDTLIGRGEDELLIGGPGRDVIRHGGHGHHDGHDHHDRDDDWFDFDSRRHRRGGHSHAAPVSLARLIDGIFARGLPELLS